MKKNVNMTISTFQAFVAVVIAIIGINYSPLVEGIPAFYLFFIYFGIFSFSAWIYYLYFHNRHTVSNLESQELEILYACCSFCNAAYDKDILDDAQLSNKTLMPSDKFTDWSNKGNRAFSCVTKLNGQLLKLSESNEPVKIAVMSFRGTSNPSEILDDVRSYKAVDVFAFDDSEEKNPIFSAGAGFVDAYNDIRKMVSDGQSMVNKFCKIADDCEGRVLIVGHSLGGAMAQLMASELSLKRPDFKIALVTFGQPRLFSTEAAALTWNFEHWRAVNDGDPVPSMPPSGLYFSHHGRPIHYNTNQNGSWNMVHDYKDFDGLDGLLQMFFYRFDTHKLSHSNKTGYMTRLKEGHLRGSRK